MSTKKKKTHAVNLHNPHQLEKTACKHKEKPHVTLTSEVGLFCYNVDCQQLWRRDKNIHRQI